MFFVLWRTAAFEADQGKVCDSLGALLLSALYSTELKLAQNTVLCSSRLADNTCTFEANLKGIGRSALFVPNTELTNWLIKWPAVAPVDQGQIRSYLV